MIYTTFRDHWKHLPDASVMPIDRALQGHIGMSKPIFKQFLKILKIIPGCENKL